MDSEKLKDIIKKLLQNELEEIKQNRFRVLVLIFFTILSIGFMFIDDEETQIALDEPMQIEQEIIESAENKKSEKKPAIIKKKHDEYSEVKVLPVIGANSDELYISDPFALKEKSETTEENDKEEISVTQEMPVITQQIAPIPALTPITPDNLPPIPEPDIALLLQQDKPILPENKEPAEEFILTGTAISGDNKLALVKKVSSTPNSNYHDESIIVKIGDSIQGQQITDIVDSKLILNNGEKYMRISGFINSGDNDDHGGARCRGILCRTCLRNADAQVQDVHQILCSLVFPFGLCGLPCSRHADGHSWISLYRHRHWSRGSLSEYHCQYQGRSRLRHNGHAAAVRSPIPGTICVAPHRDAVVQGTIRS